MSEIYGESPLQAAQKIMDEYRQDQRAMMNYYRNSASSIAAIDPNVRLIQQITKRLGIPRILARPCRIYVSQKVWDELQEIGMQIASPMPQMTTLTHFLGHTIEVSKMLPTWNAKYEIKQLDRFVTYDRSDMDWAEPLGLAQWVGGWVHAYAVDQAAFSSFPMMSPIKCGSTW